jgi:hypothetical protein
MSATGSHPKPSRESNTQQFQCHIPCCLQTTAENQFTNIGLRNYWVDAKLVLSPLTRLQMQVRTLTVSVHFRNSYTNKPVELALDDVLSPEAHHWKDVSVVSPTVRAQA